MRSKNPHRGLVSLNYRDATSFLKATCAPWHRPFESKVLFSTDWSMLQEQSAMVVYWRYGRKTGIMY